MEDNATIIRILAGFSGHGAVMEELPAEAIDKDVFRLLASPGLALNIAKGDVIALDSENRATVLKRGGNFCIHIYSSTDIHELIELLADVVRMKLQGTLDGDNGGSFAFSVPATNDFPAIRSVFDDFTQKTGLAWYYANIYANPDDQSDDTLLDWWRKSSDLDP